MGDLNSVNKYCYLEVCFIRHKCRPDFHCRHSIQNFIKESKWIVHMTLSRQTSFLHWLKSIQFYKSNICVLMMVDPSHRCDTYAAHQTSRTNPPQIYKVQIITVSCINNILQSLKHVHLWNFSLKLTFVINVSLLYIYQYFQIMQMHQIAWIIIPIMIKILK